MSASLELAAIEEIVLENLAWPHPGECHDTAVLARLEAKRLVIREGEGWALTAAGLAKLSQILERR